MRTFILLICFFNHTHLVGQSKLDIKYSADVCSCLDSLKIKGFNEQNFPECFQKAMQQNIDLLARETKKQYGDTSEENGYKFGKDLAERMSISLVKSCKSYFILTDSMRYNDFRNLNEDSIRFQIKRIKETENSKQDDELLINKALLFFELKMYDSALINLEKALAINSNNIQACYLKAWIYEIKGNYNEAILLYNKVAELTHMNSYYIFSEIAKRKKNGM